MLQRLKNISWFTSLMKLLTFITISALLLAYLCPYVHPETLWILPFFGLAYPIIMIITLVFFVYWALMRSRMFFVVLTAILIGGTLHFRTLATTFSPEVAPEGEPLLKVMSYNVRLFDVYNTSLAGKNVNRNGIIAYVNEMQPDVVCFQEFFHQDKPTTFPTKDTLIPLLKIKGYHSRYSHSIRDRQNFGICILSKYPIIAQGDVPFDNSEDTDNYCVYADVVKDGDTVRVYNVHLQSIKLQQDDYRLFGEDPKAQAEDQPSTFKLLIRKLKVAYPSRADQARKVMEHSETSPYPVIICGDFNDTPLSYVYNQFNKTMVDSYRETSSGIGVTYVGKVPAGRIDYIFHTPELCAQNFIIQKNAHSDHLAIYCELWRKAVETE